tara:strand:+ start:59 stop:196 length:138 start_codon:yes stop_codon:yes gene_type:complete
MSNARPGTYFFVLLAGSIAGESLLFVNGGFILGLLFAFGLLQLVK